MQDPQLYCSRERTKRCGGAGLPQRGTAFLREGAGARAVAAPAPLPAEALHAVLPPCMCSIDAYSRAVDPSVPQY